MRQVEALEGDHSLQGQIVHDIDVVAAEIKLLDLLELTKALGRKSGKAVSGQITISGLFKPA